MPAAGRLRTQLRGGELLRDSSSLTDTRESLCHLAFASRSATALHSAKTLWIRDASR